MVRKLKRYKVDQNSPHLRIKMAYAVKSTHQHGPKSRIKVSNSVPWPLLTVDATCLCLSISRCIDATSPPRKPWRPIGQRHSRSLPHTLPGVWFVPFGTVRADAGQATP